jgi:hypothetical protein
METELLSWFSNFINFMIIAYLSILVVSTDCFNLFQLSLSLFGLIAAIFVNITLIIIRNK